MFIAFDRELLDYLFIFVLRLLFDRHFAVLGDDPPEWQLGHHSLRLCSSSGQDILLRDAETRLRVVKRLEDDVLQLRDFVDAPLPGGLVPHPGKELAALQVKMKIYHTEVIRNKGGNYQMFLKH